MTRPETAYGGKGADMCHPTVCQTCGKVYVTCMRSYGSIPSVPHVCAFCIEKAGGPPPFAP
jgi:hypothetical protein